MPDKQNSNETELSFAEETAAIGVLPGTPEWYKLDPNDYSDFGGETVLTKRAPITKDRQERKGVVTDVDANGGFNVDLTYQNVWRLMQGFFFKDVQEKATTIPLNGTQIAITGVVTLTDDFNAASGLDAFDAGQLVYAEGFDESTNNGLHRVSASAAGALTVDTNLVDETPSGSPYIRQVGFQFDVDTCVVDASGDLPVLNRDSGTQDWTLSGIQAGDMVYVGGDTTATKFANAANNGWGRVKAITASQITFDKFDTTMVTEASTSSVTVQIFCGDRVNNDTDGNNINRRTYNFERTLGNDGGGTASEYIVGAVPSELTFNISETDKVTVDMTFVAQNHENRTGATGVKSGNRNTFVEEGAFNTSSDVSRIKLAVHNATDENPTSLFAYMNELTLTINNNVSPNKAVGVTGAFDMTEGNFMVEADLNAYFGDTTASDSVKNNDSVSLDFAIVKDNRGIAIDVPLMSLGNGRNEVVAQEAIRLPLTGMAAKDGTYNYTASLTRFSYLPTAAG